MITTYEKDLYQLDLTTATWTELDDKSTSGPRPAGRISVGLVALEGKLYVFGGYGLKGKNYRPGRELLSSTAIYTIMVPNHMFLSCDCIAYT